MEEFEEFEKFKPAWYVRLLMRFAPKIFLRFAARKQGLDDRKVKYATKLFESANRIDITPLPSRNGRGFIICLDNKLSIFFYQENDHFYFDGLEIGEYENGDVTVFDES